MIIEINIVEASSKLAHKAMIDEMLREEIIITEEEAFIENDGVIQYTGLAQEIFDKYYDYYYDELLNV